MVILLEIFKYIFWYGQLWKVVTEDYVPAKYLAYRFSLKFMMEFQFQILPPLLI